MKDNQNEKYTKSSNSNKFKKFSTPDTFISFFIENSSRLEFYDKFKKTLSILKKKGEKNPFYDSKGYEFSFFYNDDVNELENFYFAENTKKNKKPNDKDNQDENKNKNKKKDPNNYKDDDNKMEKINENDLVYIAQKQGIMRVYISDQKPKNYKELISLYKRYDKVFFIPTIIEDQKNGINVYQRCALKTPISYMNLKYAEMVLETYHKEVPIWMEIHLNPLSINYAKSVDSEVAGFLDYLFQSQKIENSFLTFTSLKGNELPIFAEKNNQKKLRYNPALVILDSRDNKSEQNQNLIPYYNSKKVIFMKDLRKMFYELLIGQSSQIQKFSEKKSFKNSHKKIQNDFNILTEVIPNQRSCEIDLLENCGCSNNNDAKI